MVMLFVSERINESTQVDGGFRCVCLMIAAVVAVVFIEEQKSRSPLKREEMLEIPALDWAAIHWPCPFTRTPRYSGRPSFHLSSSIT